MKRNSPKPETKEAKPSQPGLVLQQPKSMWTRPLKADGKGLFKSLTKAAAHGIGGKWDDLIPDTGEALTALGLGSEPGERAWLLIQRALTTAICELTAENEFNLKDFDEKPQDALIDQALESTETILNLDFFARPREVAALSVMQNCYRDWLTAHGMEQARAQTVARRLGTFFVYALHREWAKHPGIYEPIQSALKSPFTEATQREQAWQHYRTLLMKQVEEGMFQETFGLKDVYVPLRASYDRDPPGADRDAKTEPGHKATHIMVDLETEVERWRNAGDRYDAIRVISGGPGSGKSSFAKMYAAHLAERNACRTLYVPLHMFNPKADLKSAIGAWVQDGGILKSNPLDEDASETQPLLLLFDGLDELAMQGKAAQEVAQLFVQEVERTLTARNQYSARIQAIISGRDVIVQANAGSFRKPGQLLHVTPYYIDLKKQQSASTTINYEGEASLIADDQRNTWWRTYGTLTGKAYAGMPSQFGEHLDEITAQPLLNYLLALAFEQDNLDFAAGVQLNDLYRRLLKAVYDRGYERRPYRPVHAMTPDQFVRVLEEIGLAVWHGNGRTTTVREIKEHIANANITRLLEIFQEGAEAGVTRLLTAFYFRQHGSNADGDRTFEFTHKSFGEYLTVCRIVRGVERMCTELESQQQSVDHGWNEKQALKYWAELCGPTPLDADLNAFLQREIASKPPEKVSSWQSNLAKLIGYLLRNGLPMEQLSGGLTFREMQRQARNAEIALLITLNGCAKVTKRLSNIDWPQPDSAAAWIADLANVRPETALNIQAFLSYLNLEGADLTGAYLSNANLESANLERADLTGADLRGADLRGADLRGADLLGANLLGANLRGANLRGAYLRGAYLRDAHLMDANLESADLTDAHLMDANLWGADLTNADLERAYLTGAALNEVKLVIEQLTDEQIGSLSRFSIYKRGEPIGS